MTLLFLGYTLAVPFLIFILLAELTNAKPLFKLLFQGTAFVSLIIYVLLVLAYFNFITI
jgi:hypothetical protein